MGKKVILDTNFLMDTIKFRIDLNELKPLKLLTLDCVVEELKKINNKYAKAALKLIKIKKIKVIKTKEKSVDEALLKMSDKNTFIATNDSELRKKLKSIGIKTIYLRARKHLSMD